MNIISGRYKGLQIKTNKRLPYRPTSSRVRKSIFDILGNLNSLSVLDIFAGSGILGFEAASRGASEITFVDNNRKLIELIKTNSNKFDKEFNTNIICSKWDYFLKKQYQYDIIFADPPYGKIDIFSKRKNILINSHPKLEFLIIIIIKDLNLVFFKYSIFFKKAFGLHTLK